MAPISEIKTSFGAAKHIRESDYMHLVFYSYFELSVEDGERARRTKDVGGIINVVAMDELTSTPNKYTSFGQAQNTRKTLQLFVRKMALLNIDKVVVVRMMVVNNEIVKVQRQDQLGCATQP